MAQLGFLVMGGGLLFYGLAALLGWEKSKHKTQPGVAWAMVVLGLALLGFALVVWPVILSL